MSHDHSPDDTEEWDRFYTDDDDSPHWSGQPNPTLIAEASTLQAGRALDVGCGEGGDAIWLARHGWQVTAIDPSGVALGRAHLAARAAGVEVTWIPVGLLDLPDGRRGYDLVSAHYAVLRRTADDDAIAALLRAGAPGGTLLFVHHELDATHAAEHGFDPSAHVMPDTLAAHLDGSWDVEVLEARERRSDELAEDRTPRDIVLRARRRGSVATSVAPPTHWGPRGASAGQAAAPDGPERRVPGRLER